MGVHFGLRKCGRGALGNKAKDIWNRLVIQKLRLGVGEMENAESDKTEETSSTNFLGHTIEFVGFP